MPTRKRASQNLIISRLLMQVMRQISNTVLGEPLFTSASVDICLCVAVWIGHGEGKPMTSAKLAAFAGLPRPTAIRKLRALEKRVAKTQRT